MTGTTTKWWWKTLWAVEDNQGSCNISRNHDFLFSSRLLPQERKKKEKKKRKEREKKRKIIRKGKEKKKEKEKEKEKEKKRRKEIRCFMLSFMHDCFG